MNVKLDPSIVTALIAAVVAIGGTAAAWRNRNRESSDHRLDTLFTANQNLVEDLRIERDGLMRRLEALEQHNQDVDKEMRRLRDTLAEQAMEMYVLRAREVDMRAWMADIMAWAAMAVGIIRGFDRQIPDPPAPPELPDH